MKVGGKVSLNAIHPIPADRIGTATDRNAMNATNLRSSSRKSSHRMKFQN